MVFPRILTALVLGPLFLWALYWGSLPFSVLLFFLIFAALWEFHRMAEVGGYATQSWWGVALGMLVAGSMIFPGIRPGFSFAFQAPAFAVISAVVLIVLREMFRRDKGLSMLRLAMSLSAIFLIAWPLGYFILLRELRGTGNPALYHLGRNACFFLVALLWIQDTAAWAVGSSWGRYKMAAQISPKKSWEGAAAGLICAVLAAVLFREIWWSEFFSREEIIVLSVVLGVLAQFSDLAESLVKRCFGVKDSSPLLPGHGGILDRFDSFLFSTPFFYFYLIATGRGG